jgi:hypothetical protein
VRRACFRPQTARINLIDMKKHGFEIKINDEKICRAGLAVDYYVVTCGLVSMMRKKDDRDEVSIRVGGLNAITNSSVTWTDKVLKKGDKISIEIIDGMFDEPTEITIPDTEEFVLQEKINYFHKLKEELKDHLNE